MNEAFLLILIALGFVIWLVATIRRNSGAVGDLQGRLNVLESEIRQLRSELQITRSGPAGPLPPSSPVAPLTSQAVAPPPIPTSPPAAETAAPSVPPSEAPPLPSSLRDRPSLHRNEEGTEMAQKKKAQKLPAAKKQTPPPKRAEAPSMPSIDWEQFMGVKLFAWIGGFALFLGLVFFLKYAFENKLISPEGQVALEYLFALGLLGGGLYLRGQEYAVTSQTLSATSVLALYAVTFAAHSYYRLLGIVPAFAVMVLVTAAAFVLALRLDGQVVAILGLLGGFLTPMLLSTGQDNPLGLFSYIALLDAGLMAVVIRKRWNYLALLAAIGTVLIQLGWLAEFFAVSKVFIAMGVFLGFELLFLIAFVLADRDDRWIKGSAVGMAFVPLVFASYLLMFGELGGKPWTIFTFVLAADLGLLTLVLLRGELASAHLAGGGVAFLLLAVWTAGYVSSALLNWALAFYLLFAILHTAFPLVLQRRQPGAAPVWWGHLFPPLALGLAMIPVVKLPELTWLVWLCVLALDVLAFGLALVTASILAIIGALVLTLAAAAFWILQVPAVVTGVPEMLLVIGGFALIFFVMGVLAARRIVPNRPGATAPSPPSAEWLPTLPGDMRAQIPSLSAILPFVLLIMVVARMPLTNPSPVFGLAMLLVVLLLGVARWAKVDGLAAVGLACAAALEYAWHGERFKPDFAGVPLGWYLAFIAVFTLFPFVGGKATQGRLVPWATAALAGPVHFPLVYWLVKATWPNPTMGLLPAAFAILPLLGLAYVGRAVPVRSATRNALLAWFGGAALLFVTLIFPIQFERQWITVGWALEGAALLWLFHRAPHPGLRLVGVALLCVAFARLSFNPAVLDYHPRSATAILNWYLYGYGIVTACLFAGAKLLAPPRHEVLGVKAPALLSALGMVLAFLLLNIEIADYFTAPGTPTLTFQFSGDFGRDMTYSIAWALFALTLLVAGITEKLRAARYASLALLSLTLLKLFFHDLSNLNQLYRIGAFVAVAVILLVSSFLYQRFVPADAGAK